MVERLKELPDRVAAVESQLVQLRHEIRDGFSDIRSEMGAMGVGLRAQIQAGNEETRRYMRLLHEDVISRIATIGEGRPSRKRR